MQMTREEARSIIKRMVDEYAYEAAWTSEQVSVAKIEAWKALDVFGCDVFSVMVGD
jgi:hypothetical protein